MKKLTYTLIATSLLAAASSLLLSAEDNRYINGGYGSVLNVDSIASVTFSSTPYTHDYNPETGEMQTSNTWYPVFHDVQGGRHVFESGPTNNEAIVVPAGIHHPVLFMDIHDETLDFGIEGLEPGMTKAPTDEYPLYEQVRWEEDCFRGWVKEGNPLKVTARCLYCEPFVYATTGEHLSHSDTTELLMPSHPLRFYTRHKNECYHNLKMLMDNLYYITLCQYNNTVIGDFCKGVYFGGGEADLMKTYGEMYCSQDYISGNNPWPYRSNRNLGNGNEYLYNGAAWCYLYDVIHKTDTYKMQDGSSKIALRYGCADYTLLELNRYIDLYPEKASEINDMIAQALTIRANAYFHLLQIYGPRFEDSQNTEAKCLPIRDLDKYKYGRDGWTSEGDKFNDPLRSFSEVVRFIYDDLERAISLFSDAERTYKYYVNKDVACGIMARTAMLAHDWVIAEQYAERIMQSGRYDIMTADEYRSGFCVPNSDYIWTSAASYDNSEYQNYYWSHGSKYSLNGDYNTLWGIHSGAIDRELYLSMDEKDIRRECFVMPEHSMVKGSAYGQLPFWYADGLCVADSTMYCSVNLQKGGKVSMAADGIIRNYSGGLNQAADKKYTLTNIPFGAQMKFWKRNTTAYSYDAFPLMRASEMLLTLAEARIEMGQNIGALEMLNRLRQARGLDLIFANSTEDLRAELRHQRRVELWGEGFSWFDFKRWNLPIKTKAWVAGDTESGNWPSTHCIDLQPADNDGWRFAIPAREYLINSALTPPAN